jgi:flagellar basal-body rod protein FlgF
MSDGMYTSGAAMVARQVWQNAVSENLANTSTPGFKATRVFSDELKDIQSAESVHDVENKQHVFTDFTQGLVEPTGRDLDVALEGPGFFTVETPQGERYTRNGNFSLDPAGTLVDSSGARVLSESGPLTLTGDRIAIDGSGEVFVDEKSVGRLAIKNFASTAALVREGESHFAPRPGATLEPAPVTAHVRSKSLERSNVETMDEMVRMMTLMREYEASQRMVRLQSDALGRTVNELIQR